MSQIIATGHYLPKNKVSNQSLINLTGIDSTDEWIKKRSGIEYRHLAEEDETVADIATKAAENVLSKVDNSIRKEISLILVATMSSLNPTPSVANQVQAKIKNDTAWGFDISGACSGFTMAIEVANKFCHNTSSGYILIIGVEKMSQILNKEDRSTVVLFGDGAGAVLIENDGRPFKNYVSSIQTIEDKTQSLTFGLTSKDNYFAMNGREVFNFVNRQVIPAIDKFILEHHLKPDLIISHQANDRLRQLIAKKLKVDETILPSNINEVANTSAASIPILLDSLVDNGQIKLNQEQSIMLVGFGGGLAYGMNYFSI